MNIDSTMRNATDELYAVGAAVGTAGFERAALALLAALIPNDMQWLVVYERITRPRVLYFSLTSEDARFYINRDEAPALYVSGYYRFDPVYRYWREVGEPGVCTLHHMPAAGYCDSDAYISEFLPITHMEDEAVVLFQYGEDQALGVCLSRSTQFTLSEVKLMQTVYPLLAGLFESHLRLYSASNPTVTEVRFGETGSGTPLDFSAAVEEFLPAILTPRERQIVKFVLAGYPNAAIASCLGIGEGTSWNHKKRLYSKLDITSERELFSMFLGFLAKRDASELLTAV